MKTQTTQNQSQERKPVAQESVQQRAYDLYMKRGQQPGHELEDWLLAEKQVREEEKRPSNVQFSR